MISVDDFSQFFCDKVNLVLEKTAGALEPLFSSARHEASLSEFSAVLVSDVVAAILRLPDKSSIADVLPVSLMKQIAGELGPFLTKLFNRSMRSGHFPTTFKEAFITPVIKKPGLDSQTLGHIDPFLICP